MQMVAQRLELEVIEWLTERTEAERVLIINRLVRERPDVIAALKSAVEELAESEGLNGLGELGGWFDSIVSGVSDFFSSSPQGQAAGYEWGEVKSFFSRNNDTIAKVFDGAAVAAPYFGWGWASPFLNTGADAIRGDDITTQSVMGDVGNGLASPTGNWWDGIIATAQTYVQPLIQEWFGDKPKAPQQPQFVVQQAGGGMASWMPIAIAGGAALLILRK